MNLPLHTGLLGCLEAGLIAFLVGVLVYAAWAWIGRRTGMQIGHVLGWGAVIATVVAAGLDAWNLFYIGMVKLESPLYARLALAGIHDADNLGTRVMLGGHRRGLRQRAGLVAVQSPSCRAGRRGRCRYDEV